MRWRRTALCIAFLLSPFLGLSAQPVSAQFQGYFGRNKVQYKSFDFRVLKTEHFDIHYYPEEREAAVMAGRMAERWYARLARVLNHEFRARQPIILYANHSHFEQTNATPEQITEATGGFTEILKRRVVLPMAGALAETDHVLGHELVHAFQFDLTGQGTAGPGLDVPGAIRLPLWFVEGMAEYFSLGPLDPFTAMWLRDAAAKDDLPTIGQLRNPRYFPYRYGHALWSFIAGEWGEQRIGRILKLAGRSGNPEAALQAVLEIPVDSLSAMWHQAIRDYYAPVIEATGSPDAYGRRAIHEEVSGGKLNVGPAISPDGRELVFLSERGLFAVDMYLADARTGEIRRRITKSALDPHFESLQFINSSGSWHPDGRRFTFSGVSRGQPVITVVDLRSGERLEEFRLPGLGEIFGPVWSPDGRRIAFSAQVAGFLDLYLLDVGTGELTRLTADPYSDFQPTWSPDGRSLAFVTDRFGTDLDLLTYGRYSLARLDVATGEIEPLPGLPDGDSWDPQWAPDGSIYFVSDGLGIRNVYRLAPGEGRIYQVTNLTTGVSGISKLSPALSVASRTGEVAVSVYRNGPFNYEIYVLDAPEVLAGRPVPDRVASVDPAVLPPRERLSEELVALLHNPRLGLADPLTFEDADYSASLQLDLIGQPTLALAASDFGVFFAGGASLFFSDMLGDVSLVTLFQVNTRFGDVTNSTAALVGYENLKRRWNWGLVGAQIPLITRFFRSGLAGNEQLAALVIDDFRFFQVDRWVGAGFAYPFNRAQRVEFQVTARAVDFEFERRRVAFDLSTGQILQDDKVQAPTCASQEDFLAGEFCSPSSLFLAGGSAALVFDNSVFGGTSPLLGQRYRLELSPVAGSLNYLTVLGDLRKYFMVARPLAFALRGLHVGRYLPDGEDARLSRLFVGWPNLVRGYDINSFRIQECVRPGLQEIADCPVFDQLLGSRMTVANAELRLPLLGGIGLVPAPGVPPIEVGAFFDAGIAWTSDLNPCLDAELDTATPKACREPVKSVGFLTRMNLFGFTVAEVDVVKPLDRPEKGWFVQFSLQPGF